MLSQKSLVNCYERLQFVEYFVSPPPRKNNKTSKNALAFKCQICHNQSELSSAFCNCFSKQCPKKAHYYCILRNIYENQSEEKQKDSEQPLLHLKGSNCSMYLNQQRKWSQDLKIFPNSNNFDFLKYFQQRFKTFLKMYSPLSFKYLYGERKNPYVLLVPIIIVVCDQHENEFINCNCLEAEPGEINWIGCDGCGKWYHFHCEGIKSQSELGEVYICSWCRKWKKAIDFERQCQLNFESNANRKYQEQFFQLKEFPKMYFHDLVFIQNNCERRRYRLTPELEQFLVRVPFLPSIRYITETFKQKHMNPKLLKSISLIPLKKKFDKVEIDSLEERLNTPKALLQLFFKIDLLVNQDIIRAINDFAKGSYQFSDILQILDKLDRVYKKESFVSQPIIKRLKQLKGEQQNSLNDASGEKKIQQKLYKNAQRKLIGMIQDLNQAIKVKDKLLIQTSLRSFITEFSANQCMRNGAKVFIDNQLDTSGYFKAFFTYKNVEEIHQQINLKCAYRKFQQSCSLIYGISQHLQKTVAEYYRYYCQSTLKVRMNNEEQMRKVCAISKLSCSEFSSKQRSSKLSNALFFPFKKDTVELEAEYLENLKLIKIRQMVKRMMIKPINLEKLENAILKICPQNSQNYQRILQVGNNFIFFYNLCLKILESLPENSFDLSAAGKSVDLLQQISALKLDKNNYTAFIPFLTLASELNFDLLHESVLQTLKEKGNEIFDLLSGRCIPLTSESEYKMMKNLLTKVKVRSKKFQQILLKQSQLDDNLEDSLINLKLNNPAQIKNNIQHFQSAKQFCVKYCLQFRLPKLDHCIAIFSTILQAYRFFPTNFFMREGEAIPEQYQEMYAMKDRPVDFYILKKYMYKLRMIKFPQNTYFFKKLNEIYLQASEFYDCISRFMTEYNFGLDVQNFKQSGEIKRYNKIEFKQFIFSHKVNEKVSFQPQIQEISIIYDIHSDLMRKARQIVKKIVSVDFQQEKRIYSKICQLPFELDEPIIKKLKDKIQSKQKSNKKKEDLAVIVVTEANKKRQEEMPTKDNAIENLTENPRTLSLEQVREELARIQEETSIVSRDIQVIDLMIQSCISIQQKHVRVLNKFIKKQTYTLEELEEVKWMIKEYDKQMIRIEIMENISAQYKMYERLDRYAIGQEERSFISKSLAKSFSSIVNSSNSVANSSTSRQSEPASSSANEPKNQHQRSKSKKQTRIYRTYAEKHLNKKK